MVDIFIAEQVLGGSVLATFAVRVLDKLLIDIPAEWLRRRSRPHLEAFKKHGVGLLHQAIDKIRISDIEIPYRDAVWKALRDLGEDLSEWTDGEFNSLALECKRNDDPDVFEHRKYVAQRTELKNEDN